MAIVHAITATERLIPILQSIALKQQTGCLSIEHMTATGSEKGEVFFVHGDTIFARTEHASGKEALGQILTWPEVRYVFTVGEPAQTAQRKGARLNGIVFHPSAMRHLLPVETEETREERSISKPAISKNITQPLPVSVTMPRVSIWPRVPALPPPLARGVANIGKHGIAAVFRTLPYVTTPAILLRLERRDRIVLLLLDGKRTLQDVARLVHRSELDIAQVLARMLKRGYIEYLEA